MIVIGTLCIASCARNNTQEAGKIPAAALEGAGPVYSAFIDYLNKGPHDNDFTRFASNPKNFTVSIKDHGDRFVYTFVISQYRGGPVLDGMISYSWSKGSGKIERTPEP
jgi:hypothetical protein